MYASVERFLRERLKLTVNHDKSSHSPSGRTGVCGLRVSWLWRSDSGEQEETRRVQTACCGDLSSKPRCLDEITLRDVPLLCARLAQLLWTGSSEDNVRELGQVASSPRSSLLLEAVAEVENSAEETDFPGRVLSCRSRICDERQRPLASFHDVGRPARFIQRVPGRRGLVQSRRVLAIACILATKRLVRTRNGYPHFELSSQRDASTQESSPRRPPLNIGASAITL